MRWTPVLVVSAVVLAGCSEYGYHYQAQPQILANPVFADYRERGNVVDILVDTDALRLNQVVVVRADGTLVKPTSIDYPSFEPQLMGGTDDAIYGPEMAQGPTTAHFDKAAIGPGPWAVRADIVGEPSVTFHVGGALARE